jgi:hypothetical protein
LPPEILPLFRQTFTEQASGPQPDICCTPGIIPESL